MELSCPSTLFCNSLLGKPSNCRKSVKKVGGRRITKLKVAGPMELGTPSSEREDTLVKWGSVGVQGAREEMEDDMVLRVGALHGYSFAAVFDGHAGFSSVKFLKDHLYRECAIALQDGLLLESKDVEILKSALQKAFLEADRKLLTWFTALSSRLENTNDGADSGSTATIMFLGPEHLLVSHIGDSSVVNFRLLLLPPKVLSRAGKAVEITAAHRPYGRSKASHCEIKRIKEAGGWISNGRICGDISVSRAFGDMRFKTQKKQMLEEGIQEGKWTQKFVSRIKLKGDWVTAIPDVYQTYLSSEIEFIIMASDGLWDCMKSSDAVKFVRSQLKKHGDVQYACEALANAALNQNAQDNISIIIADMGRVLQHDVPEDEKNLITEVVQATATIAVVISVMWLSSFLG